MIHYDFHVSIWEKLDKCSINKDYAYILLYKMCFYLNHYQNQWSTLLSSYKYYLIVQYDTWISSIVWLSNLKK